VTVRERTLANMSRDRQGADPREYEP
jgi:hypothetical protein